MYLGLLLFVAALLGYWYFFLRPNGALGPEIGYFGGAIAGWLAFLTCKSGVATSLAGREYHRNTSPRSFWFEVIFYSGLSLLALFFAVNS